MIRVVVVYGPEWNDLPPQVQEYNETDPGLRDCLAGIVGACLSTSEISSFSVQRVSQWWTATWSQLTPGCEVRSGQDGSTWVVSRGISELSPHEVEIYKFGEPEKRFTFTPQYGQPVQARMTQESSMRALLMTELGARLIDDGG